MIRSAVAARKHVYGKAMISGPMVYGANSDGGGVVDKYIHLVVPLADHACEEVVEVWFDDQLCTDFGGYRLNTHLGSPGQTADSDLISEVADLDINFKLSGITYLYIRFDTRHEDWLRGVPGNIKALVKGHKVYDPREVSQDPDDASTWAWSDNASLCINDYITGSYGLGAVYGEEVSEADLIAAANVCDEAVAIPGGGTQARYTCNGIVDTSVDTAANLSSMTTAIGGGWAWVQGSVRVFPGAYDAPTGELSDDELRGSIQITPRTPRQDLFNTIHGVYVGPQNAYQPADFPEVTVAAYVAQDGEKIVRDIELPFTDDPFEAQRIAKVALEREREAMVVKFPANWSALNFSVNQNVSVSLSAGRDGGIWTDKVFKITSWELAADGGGVDLMLREDAAATYTWSAADATPVDDAPNSNLGVSTAISPPVDLAVEEELYTTRGGLGVKSRAVFEWGAPATGYVLDYQVEWKLTANALWNTITKISDTRVVLQDMATGSHDFRVKAYNIFGKPSAYTSLTKILYGLTAAPADVSDFYLSAINNTAHLSWSKSTDLDVTAGGTVRIRHTPRVAAATWANSNDIGPAIPGSSTSATLPLISGTYLIKFVDSTGHESDDAASIVTTVPNMLTYNAVETLTEHASFTGSKTNLEVVGDDLKFVTMAASTLGTYEFPAAGYVDLGEVYTSRLSAAIKFSPDITTDLISARTGNVSTWASWGTIGAVMDVRTDLYVATTDDDPSSSPTWSSWGKFVVGDYSARAFKFKLEARSDDETHQILIEEISVSIDMPDRVEASRAISSLNSGNKTVTYARSFKETPALGVTVSDMATGDRVAILNEANTGFDISVYNSGGSRVVRTFTYMAKGF